MLKFVPNWSNIIFVSMNKSLYEDRLEKSLSDTYIWLLQRRMLYGIKTVSGIFQRTIEQVIGGNIKKMYYQGNICIGVRNEIDLKKENWNCVVKEMQETLTGKCVHNSSQI